VLAFLRSTGLKPKCIRVQSPWRNGVAERWVGSCRYEILDPVVVFNERHLGRLMREYVNSYHPDRIHDWLGKDTPMHRPVDRKISANTRLISNVRLGDLHHRYSWRDAA
jgi:hypothetical protein